MSSVAARSGQRRRTTASVADKLIVVSAALRICDALAVVVAGFMSYWLRHGSFDLPDAYLLALTTGAVLTLNYLQMGRVYANDVVRRPTGSIGALTAAWAGVMGTLIILAYFTKTSDEFSRLWVILWFALSYASFVAVRLVLELQLMQWERGGTLTVNVAIVGTGEAAERVALHLARQPGGHRVVGVFGDDAKGLDAMHVGGTRRGAIDDLLDIAREERIDEIVLAEPWRTEEELLSVLKRLKSLSVIVHLGPDAMALPRLPTRGFTNVAGLPMLNIHDRPLSGWGLLLKSVEDRILAALILVLASPAMAIIAAAIKLESRGPALFRQRRYGFHNDEIVIFKFRTMYADSEPGPEAPQATRDDGRVTRVGAFLRRTSLDELPQLFNVLHGEMSLVGPRPHAVAHNIKYAVIIDDYLSRHRVKPGITGWAQVNGFRGETDTAEKMRARVEHDLYYIDNWSLLFDLRILALTLFYGFVHKNAY
jgi:Undecaprenyl-phosphate glucose phosphotransferase